VKTSSTPYVELDREVWRELRAATPLPLTGAELDELRGLGDPIDLDEVRDVYLPLSRLLHLYVAATRTRHAAIEEFLAASDRTTGGAPMPFVIGVAGSVAVGKSTVSRLLRLLLGRWQDHPRVELVGTDNFLHPNAVLEERGIMHRKGFPESYDRKALLRFVSGVKAGEPEMSVPVYSHLEYDIVKGARQTVRRPDILILEGINVLQPALPGRLAVSDFFDFSVYVDARLDDIRRWYSDRLLELWRTAFTDPSSYFHQFTNMSREDVLAFAKQVWHDVNEVNLVENIEPTRGRATLVLRKGPDHAVRSVRLRKP
jgi:type I pantothenate kinase